MTDKKATDFTGRNWQYSKTNNLNNAADMYLSDDSTKNAPKGGFFSGIARHNEYESRVETFDKSLGPAKLSYSAYDEYDNLLSNRKIWNSELKKWVMTDSEGKVSINNKARADFAKKAHDDLQRRVKEVMSYVLTTDELAAQKLMDNELAAQKLMISVDELRATLGSGNDIE